MRHRPTGYLRGHSESAELPSAKHLSAEHLSAKQPIKPVAQRPLPRPLSRGFPSAHRLQELRETPTDGLSSRSQRVRRTAISKTLVSRTLVSKTADKAGGATMAQRPLSREFPNSTATHPRVGRNRESAEPPITADTCARTRSGPTSCTQARRRAVDQPHPRAITRRTSRRNYFPNTYHR